MGIVYKNNAKTTLSSGILSTDTSIDVDDASVFPSLSGGDYFLVTFDDGTNNEIVKCTAVSSNTLTVTRAQEGTTARAFSSGDAAENRVTAGTLDTITTISVETLSDTNITSPADASVLFYDTGTSKWIDNVVSGDITIADTGVAAIGSGVIVNDDINASAAISVSKTALVDGTGLTLTGDTLSVDASQTQITAVGTLTTGTWNATSIADAYVDNNLTIDGGTVDNSVIGGSTPAAGTFTTLTANTSITGTLATAAQTNITSVGTLSSLTVSGDVTVDTNTLYVDSTANAVGIGTVSPGEALEVVGNVEASGEFIGDLRGAVVLKAKAGEAITKGEAVYISGISGGVTVVSRADANVSSKMPAVGISSETVSLNASVTIYTFGALGGIDTSAYSEGDELFVDTNPGALSATAPTSESAAVQKIAKVTRSDASVGSIIIMGAGRSNAVPNLNDGNIFIGNASNQSVSAALDTKIEDYLDTGTSTPTFASATVTGDFTVDTSTLKVDSTNNRVGIGNATPDVSLDIGSNTDAVHLPTGTTAQRPGTPAAGYFRYNSEVGQFEGYTTEWVAIAGSGSNTFTTDTFTGNGSTTAFTLSQSIADENNLVVFNGGVFQNQSAYSVSGTTLTFDTAPANGNTVVVYSVASAVSGNNLNLDQFTGDGSTTGFTLSINPVNENNTQVFIDGVYQQKDGYTTSGTTLTFDTAPPNTATIEVMTFTQTDINTATILKDADEDTKVQVEESADEDIIRFDTAGTERMVINSTGVGIGTSSPDKVLTISASDSQIRLYDADGTNQFASFQSDNGIAKITSRNNTSYGQITFQRYDGTTVTESMRIDASGNVGIGTSSPDYLLTMQDNSTVDGSLLTFKNQYRVGTTTADTMGGIAFSAWRDVSTSASYCAAIYAKNTAYPGTSGHIVFATRTNGDTDASDIPERMRIDSSGNVGIGTSSPVSILHTTGSTGITLGAVSGDTWQTAAIKPIDEGASYKGTLAFYTHPQAGSAGSPTERMRIDSSGNLLVGTTDTAIYDNSAGSSADNGFVYDASSSRLDVTRYSTSTSSAVALLNKTGVDGSILELRKDGATVGSIGSAFGYLTVLGSTNQVGLKFYSAVANTGVIHPVSGTADLDAAVDLGYSGGRFKDLYLSGGVYVGGTGSANKLDDYEEGTWTPALSGTGYSFGTNTGAYVKVGRMVYATAKLNVTTVGANNSNFAISGFPFTAYNASLHHQVGMVRQSSTTGRIYVVQINSNSTSGGINAMDGIANGDNEIITTGDYAVSITYMTS